MATSLERLVRNQLLLRDVNDPIAGVAASWMDDPPALLCECSDSDCTETLVLSRREYEIIRSTSNLFVIHRGHEHPDVDRLVQTNDRFALVDKTRHTDLVFSLQRHIPLAAV